MGLRRVNEQKFRGQSPLAVPAEKGCLLVRKLKQKGRPAGTIGGDWLDFSAGAQSFKVSGWGHRSVGPK